MQSMIDRGGRSVRTTTPLTLGPSASLVTVTYLPVNAGHVYEIEGLLIVDGPRANDLRVQIRAASAVRHSGWFSVGAAPDAGPTSTTATSMLPAAVANIPADFSVSLVVGLVGARQRQMIPIRGFLSFGTAPGTVGLYAAPAVNDGGTLTVSYASLKLTRVE